jgi:hypothetical protein
MPDGIFGDCEMGWLPIYVICPSIGFVTFRAFFIRNIVAVTDA